MNVKVRFAPSPTGLLHVGNIRIAILNYLFAKNQNGKFVLRIDDTDKERSTIESENLILEDLKWLGIEWNEFYKQSNHFPKYREAMEYLKSIGRIYPCYETKEELSLKRKIQASKGVPPVYDRAAMKLSDQEKSKLEDSGVQKYWRFKLNENENIEWNDLVHGKISIPLSSISDPIIVKPDGSYVYTFASVVDDVNIGITHIIRGDDHITNTAAQIDIFRALSGNNPEFAHVPLLSSIDGQDVSKRTSSSLSMVNLRNAGMEPQAIINVLSSLGTSDNVSPEDSFKDLIRKFSFSKMSLSSPKFNVRDVELLTRKFVSEKTFDEVKSDLVKISKNVSENISESIAENTSLNGSENIYENTAENTSGNSSEDIAKNISEEFWEIIKGNINTLKEVDFWYDIFYKDIPSCVEELDQNYLNQMLEGLAPSVDFDEWISLLKKISGRRGRDLFHPIRMVLTNQDTGPELRKIFAILGYEKIKNRIEKNIKRIS